MSVELDMRKWCTIIKLEGYTTPSSAQALAQKFREIVETFEDEGVDIDVFMFLEDEHDPRSLDEPAPRKPNRQADDSPSD
jgi:hypothetical protein